MADVSDSLADRLSTARDQGWRMLLETEALQICQSLGIGVPSHVIVVGPEDLHFDDLSGERVVAKVLSPALAHKTEAGGVIVAPRADARTAVATLVERFPKADQFLVAEYVEHGREPWGEMLLGMRWTDAFGPIVTFGYGGVATEFIAGVAGAAVFSPALAGSVSVTLDGFSATAPLIDGFRGGVPSVSRDALEALIGAMLSLAATSMPDEIAEFEINPLVFTADGPVALDALCRLGPAPVAEARPDLRAGSAAGVLRPETIGIVGVSERMNLGRVILGNVLSAGFPADGVTVVKTDVDEIDGVRCVPDLRSMGHVDLLVVAVGADRVPDLIDEVAADGLAGSVVLIAGGLGEREGSEAHADRIVAALRAAPHPRPVVNGGNCMGIRSVPGQYDTTFIPAHKMTPKGRSGRHPVAVISQSGAFVIARLDRLAWLDPAYLITVGNQIDLTVGDYLDHVADDPGVAVAACYVEGFRPGDGLRWAGAAARMRLRGGRVILYLAGRTAEGARSAVSHTASVAGDAAVALGIAGAVGALVAESLEEFEDLLRVSVLLAERPFAGGALGAVSNAGFEAVAIADNLGPLSLAEIAPGTTARIEEILAEQHLSGIVAAANPLDLTPNCGAEAYADAVAAVLADPGVDVGLVGCVPLTPSLATLAAGDEHDEDVASVDSLASRLVTLWQNTTKPWAAVVDGGYLYDPMARRLEDDGIPTFRSADRAVRALRHLAP